MNQATTALRDALGSPIKNGPTLSRPKGSRSWGGRTIATPVVTSYVPLWRCDSTSCPKAEREGRGGEEMMAHAARFHGRRGRFSDLRAQD